MANPTTNFGWQMPQNTDLVKDLPADFEVFGQAVDTDLADLKGGTTGQILSKTSNTDLDFTWINNDQGDITEVQAGTGISVSSGTGPVPVITNTVATEFDAKGDLIIGTGSDTFDRLAVGTDGYTLVADSAETTGLKWVAPSSTPTFVGCGVTNSGVQSISNNTETDLTFNTEDFDTNGFHSTATNTARMTIPAGYAGYYRVAFLSYWDDNATGHRDVSLNKNGSLVRAYRINPYGRAQSVHYFVLNLAEGDYITISVLQNSGGSLNIVNNTAQFSIQWLGA